VDSRVADRMRSAAGIMAWNDYRRVDEVA